MLQLTGYKGILTVIVFPKMTHLYPLLFVSSFYYKDEVIISADSYLNLMVIFAFMLKSLL